MLPQSDAVDFIAAIVENDPDLDALADLCRGLTRVFQKGDGEFASDRLLSALATQTLRHHEAANDNQAAVPASLKQTVRDTLRSAFAIRRDLAKTAYDRARLDLHADDPALRTDGAAMLGLIAEARPEFCGQPLLQELFGRLLEEKSEAPLGAVAETFRAVLAKRRDLAENALHLAAALPEAERADETRRARLWLALSCVAETQGPDLAPTIRALAESVYNGAAASGAATAVLQYIDERLTAIGTNAEALIPARAMAQTERLQRIGAMLEQL